VSPLIAICFIKPLWTRRLILVMAHELDTFSRSFIFFSLLCRGVHADRASAIELLKVLAQRLVERENVSNSWAMTSVRRRVQSGFMKQIAINGLTYVRKIRAQMGAGQL
jgi:hypothetical protein